MMNLGQIVQSTANRIVNENPRFQTFLKTVEQRVVRDGKFDLHEVAEVVLSYVSPDLSGQIIRPPQILPSPSPPARIMNPNNLSPGVAIIINNQSFENIGRRYGSEKDVELLKETFQKYSLLTLVVQDPTHSEIQHVINKVNEINFENRSCFVITILTHGMRYDHLWSSDDKSYSLYDDVLFPLFKPLEGITKIVFTQACKGLCDLANDSYELYPQDNGNYLVCSGETEIDLGVKKPKGRPDDVFRLDSSYEGYVSKRHNTNGSFFINSLCKNLNEFGDDKSIQEIAEMVQTDVKDNPQIYGLQYPSVNSTMSTPFYFGDFRKDESLEKPFTNDLNEFLELSKNT